MVCVDQHTKLGTYQAVMPACRTFSTLPYPCRVQHLHQAEMFQLDGGSMQVMSCLSLRCYLQPVNTAWQAPNQSAEWYMRTSSTHERHALLLAHQSFKSASCQACRPGVPFSTRRRARLRALLCIAGMCDGLLAGAGLRLCRGCLAPLCSMASSLMRSVSI